MLNSTQINSLGLMMRSFKGRRQLALRLRFLSSLTASAMFLLILARPPIFSACLHAFAFAVAVFHLLFSTFAALFSHAFCQFCMDLHIAEGHRQSLGQQLNGRCGLQPSALMKPPSETLPCSSGRSCRGATLCTPVCAATRPRALLKFEACTNGQRVGA